MKKIFLYKSKNIDAAYNLAAEEYFYKEYNDERFILIYKNDNIVIGGKNQNPWKEANIPFLTANNIPYIRRISGGGCVFHDTGNINFSFIGPKSEYDQKRNLGFLQNTLSSLGIESDISERGDLLVGGKKVSGNAMAFSKTRYIHHFTLLVETNLNALRKSLKNDPGTEYTGSAVSSNPMSVLNLNEIKNAISQEELINAFVNELKAHYHIGEWTHDIETDIYISKYSAHDWNFAKTPAFSVKSPFLTELVRFILEVHKGQLKEIKTEDLSFNSRDMDIPFSLTALKNGLPKNIPERPALFEWLATFVS